MILPIEVLRDRLRNELKASAGYLRQAPDMSGKAHVKFPITIEIELNQVPAYYVVEGKCSVRYSHRFQMEIGEDYPYKKPTVHWLTPIFHPNIMMPEDGGHMCTKLLELWGFESTIISFIKGAEALIASPNPSNPFGSDSCTAAAEFYNKGMKRLPPMVHVPPPRVVERR